MKKDITVENHIARRNEYTSKLCRRYNSLEEFSDACAVDIFNNYYDMPANGLPTEERLFNISQLMLARAHEMSFAKPISTETEELKYERKHPVSAAIALKIMLPMIYKELTKERSFGVDGYQKLIDRFDVKEILTDIYIKLNDSVARFAEEKTNNVKDTKDLEGAFAGYVKFDILSVISDYARDHITREDFKNGRRADYGLHEGITRHDDVGSPSGREVGFYIPVSDGAEKETYRMVSLDANEGALATHNFIEAEANRNDEREFKQARIFIYGYQREMMIKGKQPMKTQHALITPKEEILEPGKYLVCSNNVRREFSHYTIGNLSKNKHLLPILDMIKKLSDEDLDRIIKENDIPELPLDSYYHGITKDVNGFECSTRTSMHEVNFDVSKMPGERTQENKSEDKDENKDEVEK